MRRLALALALFPGIACAEYVCERCVEVLSTATPSPTATATPRPIRTVTFTESQAIIGNPGIGWQSTQRTPAEAGNIRGVPSSSMVFRLYAEEVNPSPGVFNWTLVDSAKARAVSAGQTINFRFVMFDPWGGNWLRNHIPGRLTRCTAEGGGTFFAPDFDSVTTQQRHRELIEAFATRYGNDPAIEHVDAGSNGSYAEWHHWCQVIAGTNTPLPLPSEASRALIMRHYHEALPNKTKILILDDPISRAEGKRYGFGWRADCWHGHHETTLYPGWLVNPDMSRVWESAPVLLEPCGRISSWADIAVAVDQAIAKRASLINSKNYLDISDAQWPEIQRLLRKLGYRIVVDQVTVDGGTLTVKLRNVGIAPNYRPIRIEAGNSSIEISRIMPQEMRIVALQATTPTTLRFSMNGREVKTANVEYQNGGLFVP